MEVKRDLQIKHFAVNFVVRLIARAQQVQKKVVGHVQSQVKRGSLVKVVVRFRFILKMSPKSPILPSLEVTSVYIALKKPRLLKDILFCCHASRKMTKKRKKSQVP